MQVAIINNGQVISSYANGWATKDTDLMTTEHKIRVASIAKVIIGITAMLLQEDGIIDIDASFASGDIINTDMLVTLYRERGEIARSVETQKNILLSGTPGGNGAYFAGGFTISAYDLAKIVALLAADGRYEGQQLLAESSVAQMEEYITEPLLDGSYQAQPLFYVPGLYGRSGIYFHTGSAFGVLSCISYDSNTGDGVGVLTTGANEASEHCGLSYVFDKINSYIYELLIESF